jgi:hypothetical protein
VHIQNCKKNDFKCRVVLQGQGRNRAARSIRLPPVHACSNCGACSLSRSVAMMPKQRRQPSTCSSRQGNIGEEAESMSK